MGKKITTEQFIERSKLIHGDKYDYSLSEYKAAKIKVKIKCNSCGSIFEQTPEKHLLGRGCPECKKKRIREKLLSKDFIERSKIVYGNKYDYSLVEYINSKAKVKIKCNSCGNIFEQTPSNHLSNHGCPFCWKEKINYDKKRTLGEFISLSKKIHGNKYDYSLVEYINDATKVKIICPEHGEFEQTPNKHLLGHGCPRCKDSHGEGEIANFLKNHQMPFVSQKTFDDLRDKKLLSYDFYLPDYNLLIEYNGIQHYKSIKFFGGDKYFYKQKHHDWLKRKYAKDNGINLLVIPYKEDVKKYLTKLLKYGII